MVLHDVSCPDINWAQFNCMLYCQCGFNFIPKHNILLINMHVSDSKRNMHNYARLACQSQI